MEHIKNDSPTAATDEPAVPSTCAAIVPGQPAAPAAFRSPGSPASTGLTESLIANALSAGDSLSGTSARHDGWNPDRIRVFLRTLAATACVKQAARAAGLTKQSAYVLRASTRGRAFALAWDAALCIGRGRLADDLLSRALHGTVESVYRDGQVVEQRHRYDSRLGLAMLARLDRLFDEKTSSNAARYVSSEFDQFVEIAAAGGEGAAGFVASRCALGYSAHDEKAVLKRAENFAATGEGLPEGHEADSPVHGLMRALGLLGEDEEEEEDFEEDDVEDDDVEEDEDEDEDELDEDGEDELDDDEDEEDEPDGAVEGDDPDRDEPGADRSGEDAPEEHDPETDDDPRAMSYQEFERSLLEGPLGEILAEEDEDEEETERLRREIEEGRRGFGSLEADIAWTARRIEAALRGEDRADP